jgi:hypothetical protein
LLSAVYASTDLLAGLEKVMVMKDANNRNEMLVSSDFGAYFIYFWIPLIHFILLASYRLELSPSLGRRDE